MTQTISTEQRFRRYGMSCPICQGHAGLKQGIGERCAGYLSDDGEYVYCTREEFAGNLERNEHTQPSAFCHKLYGTCNCGKEHNPAHPSSNGHKAKAKPAPPNIVREYSYKDAQGNL